MARAVVLNFDSNDAAEAFVNKLDKAQADRYQGVPIELAAILCASAEVKALLPRPTIGCKCRGLKTNRNHKNAFGRTIRFGWFVHVTCKKPSQYVVDNYWKNLIISSGNNLLQELRDKYKVVEQTNPPEDNGGNTIRVDVHVANTTEGSVT